MRHKHSHNAIKILIFIAVIFCSSVLLYTNIVSNVKKNVEITTNEFKENQFKSIWLYLEILQAQSEQNVIRVSSDIENDILSLSDEELEDIEIDMSNNVYNKTLHNIFMKNIQNESLNQINNHRNGIVIMSTKGFIEDYNYRRSQNKNEDSVFRTWQDSLNSSYNKALDKNAFDKLLNRTSGIIALESYDLVNNDNHIMIKELNYDSLLNVFMNEGIEGLRNYQIFVPYYITDLGDIFGKNDIIQGIKEDNNKIIVAQEFNLYDQLVINETNIFNNEEIKDLNGRYVNLLNTLYIFGIGLVAGMFALVIYLCNFYNNIVIAEETKEDLENKNNSEDTEEEIKNTTK